MAGLDNNCVVCKHCKSTNTRKYGFVDSAQTYFCNDCRRKFKADDRLYRMKTPFIQVVDALDDYYKGKSINDIRDSLNVHYQNYPSSKTVYAWIQKYTDDVSERFRDYRPQVGDIWIAADINYTDKSWADIIRAEQRQKQRKIHRRTTMRTSRKAPRITPPIPQLRRIND